MPVGSPQCGLFGGMLLNTSKKAFTCPGKEGAVSVQKMISKPADRARGFTLVELLKTTQGSADPEDKKPAPADK